MTHLDKAIRLDKEKFERQEKSRYDRHNLLLKNKMTDILTWPAIKEFEFRGGKGYHSKIPGYLCIIEGMINQVIGANSKEITRPREIVLKQE